MKFIINYRFEQHLFILFPHFGVRLSVSINSLQLPHCPSHKWRMDMHIDRKEQKCPGGKPIAVLLCPTQVPHGVPWDRTWASAVRSSYLGLNVESSEGIHNIVDASPKKHFM